MVLKLAIVGAAAYVVYRLYSSANLPQATSAGVRIAGGDPQPSGGGAIVPTSRGTSVTGWVPGGDPGPSGGRIGLPAPHGQNGSFAGAPPAPLRVAAAPGGWNAQPVVGATGPSVQSRAGRGHF